MIFESIKLQNFRQYKEPVAIDFSNPENSGKNITLIIADNGVGKTTLLQAFRYCLYGQNSKFLNLPGARELINNKLEKEMNELDKETMTVELSFKHGNKKYIAKRTQKFLKRNGVLVSEGDEDFSLLEETSTKGYQEIIKAEQNIKINEMLPETLSQIFMFDGERMERNFAEKDFGRELKESVLGILDIHKYDRLANIIGKENQTRKVLGMLSEKIKTQSFEEKEAQRNYHKILNSIENLQKDVFKIDDRILEANQQLESVKQIQQELADNKVNIEKREKIDQAIQNNELLLVNKANEYLSKTKNALIQKLLLVNKPIYEGFLTKGNLDTDFYNALHVHTLDDILEKEECLCGRPVFADSAEAKKIELLKRVALPLSAAQNLNLIDNLIKRSITFNETIEELKSMYETILELRKQIKIDKNEYRILQQKIREIEEKFGVSDYENFEALQESILKLSQEHAIKSKDLQRLEKAAQEQKAENIRAEKQNSNNAKVRYIMELVEQIKKELEAEKLEKDREARKVLSTEFNKILNRTLHGDYSVNIDDNYRITIINNRTKIDETSILSTGQNVVVSLSFINALIETARELSLNVYASEKYGVIMDAALSSLDESHIDRICNNNLNSLDQLVFMSFKRQLRNEMYYGIRDSIGKAYLLRKNTQGFIEKETINIRDLDDFIHSYKGE